MKVLVVDDNVAIQEILKDILIENGHIVKIAGSIGDAVKEILEFKPDAILLDALVNDEDGLQILTRAHEIDSNLDISAVLVKGVNDEVPQDNAHIKATVNKPFKSSDITAALNQLMAKKEEERLEKEGNKKSLFGGLFGKKKKVKEEHIAVDDAAIVAEYIAGDSPLFGRSYVFFEKEPKKIYEFIQIFNSKDYSFMIISSENAKALKQTSGIETAEIITLSGSGRGKTNDIKAMGTLMVTIKEFVNQHDNPIVLIDNFTDIIDSNGLNNSLLFIHQLIKNRNSDRPVSFLVSVDQSILTMKDRNILLGDMSEYSN